MKKVYLLVGNPNTDPTLSSALADQYEAAAKAAGHEVRRAHVGALRFDPILHKGYHAIQELEPDLLQVQEDLKWCDHFVLIYPLWWSSAPSLLKGLFDRMWLPGFAFRFIKGKDGKSTLGWHRLLKGKSARVIVTLKNHPLVERFMFGDYTAELASAVLGFSGFAVRITEIGNAEALSPGAVETWFRKMERLGAKAR